MKTIVKGKVIYTSYKLCENLERWSYAYNLHIPEKIANLSIENAVKTLNSRLIELEKDKIRIQNGEPLYVLTKKDYDYETFYKTENLNYTLNEGDRIHIDEETHKIEAVEGVDTNCIIYYTDKIIKEVLNEEQYKNILDKAGKITSDCITKVEKSIYYYNKIISETIKENNKKWWQFWK